MTTRRPTRRKTARKHQDQRRLAAMFASKRLALPSPAMAPALNQGQNPAAAAPPIRAAASR